MTQIQDGKLEVDVGDLVAKELGKRERKIDKLTEENRLLKAEIRRYKETLQSLELLKTAINDAADLLDPYRRDDW